MNQSKKITRTSPAEINGSEPIANFASSPAPGETCESVDLAVLTSFEVAQTDGAPDIVVELIDLYLEDAPRRLAALEEAVELRDESSLRLTAHCLRGSSGSIGAPRMALICTEVEQMESENLLPNARKLVDGLVLEFERVRELFLIERQRRTGARPAAANLSAFAL
jgi:HPt (histidine-containing phosphotransfer) domain-containing protein